jgi:hypothetical protein
MVPLIVASLKGLVQTMPQLVHELTQPHQPPLYHHLVAKSTNALQHRDTNLFEGS